MSAERKEVMKQSIQVLDTLLENEKKSKLLTVIVILGFCLLGIAIVYLGSQLSKKEKELQQQLDEKKLLVEKLNTALQRLDSLQTSLENSNKVLSTSATESDSIKKESISLLNSLQSKYDSLQKQTIELQKRLNIVIKPATENILKEKVQNIDKYARQYKCFIQYMPGFEAEAKRAYYALKDKDWYDKFVAENEKIENQSFNSYIKYFDKNDQKLAYEMYRTLLNAKIEMYQEPLLVDLPGASKKIEIWLGKATKKSVEDILNNPRYQNKLHKQDRKF